MRNTNNINEYFNDIAIRNEQQSNLLRQFGKPIMTLTLNIPSSLAKEKYTDIIFHDALDAIKAKVSELNFDILTRQITHSALGSEALFVMDSQSANDIKKHMMEIERTHPLGTLFNLDVMNHQGKMISRKSCNMITRKCPICSQSAQSCSRNNRHSLEEIQTMILSLSDKHVSPI
ncbi:citrate lyase holo-[acyl-carrier protein] synthase [Vibrio lamellibrachiae]|uniref:citrate lyase holo-[acyl-carrier protein] synthase n=1 Tax=Vibrio lamellibrachiae TaxID=2910253 RepID=UPI003D0BAA0D